jgi:hypothetical protein
VIPAVVEVEMGVDNESNVGDTVAVLFELRFNRAVNDLVVVVEEFVAPTDPSFVQDQSRSMAQREREDFAGRVTSTGRGSLSRVIGRGYGDAERPILSFPCSCVTPVSRRQARTRVSDVTREPCCASWITWGSRPMIDSPRKPANGGLGETGRRETRWQDRGVSRLPLPASVSN